MTKKQTNFLIGVIFGCSLVSGILLLVAFQLDSLKDWATIKKLMGGALGCAFFAFGVSFGAWLDEKKRNDHIKRWNRILRDYDNF